MDKRLLTIQDISCVGQCSLTVALPVISACGIETAILPSSVLSNHTAKGFTGWTFCDLTEEMPKILEQWKKENISFDAFYTGYVSKSQIPYIINIMKQTARPGALKIVDPVMADNGLLYKGFDEDFPQHMLTLCREADVVLPNITEASLMLGLPYKAKDYDEAYIKSLIMGLIEKGARRVVLTGVSFEENKLGIACYEPDSDGIKYYFNMRYDVSLHGTGDAYASAFVGALMRGKSLLESASIAADFVVESIRITIQDPDHWYGVKFEKALPYLISRM